MDIVDRFAEISETIDRILSSHDTSTSLQVPSLVSMVFAELGNDKGDIKAIDHAVRFYLRSSSEWSVSRGIKGGVVPISKVRERERLKVQKESVKKELSEKIHEMTAPKADED